MDESATCVLGDVRQVFEMEAVVPGEHAPLSEWAGTCEACGVEWRKASKDGQWRPAFEGTPCSMAQPAETRSA